MGDARRIPMKTRIMLMLACLAFAPAHADDASLRALRGILESRGAEMDDRIDAARSLAREDAARSAPILARALDDPAAAIRVAAADALWALALSDAPGAQDAVRAQRAALEVALGDVDPAVAVRAASALEASGTPRESLAVVRRAVLAARGVGPYERFVAARGLVGLEPARALAAALEDYGTWLYAEQAAGRRGGIGDDLGLLDAALARFVREGGTDAATALAALTDTASPVVPHLLAALAVAPPPDWIARLLAATRSPHAATAERAWALLGARKATAELAQWAPAAVAALDDPRQSAAALDALREVAGRTREGLAAASAIARSRADADLQRMALELLARASDATSSEVAADVLSVARDEALAAFLPRLASGPRDAAFDVALDAMPYTVRDDAERAKLLGEALGRNPDPAARIALIGALAVGGTRSSAAATAVQAFAESPDPATREAAQRTLSSIAPAWRESRQRAATGAGHAVAPVAPGTRGVAMMPLMEAIRSGDPSRVARLVPREKANAGLVMPDGRSIERAPLDTAIDHCGLPQIPPAQLLAVVRVLLAQGADPERPGPDGDTPLTRAKYACPEDIVAALAAP
jgi:hypothetical protein